MYLNIFKAALNFELSFLRIVTQGGKLLKILIQRKTTLKNRLVLFCEDGAYFLYQYCE